MSISERLFWAWIGFMVTIAPASLILAIGLGLWVSSTQG